MNNTQILLLVIILVFLWVYFQPKPNFLDDDSVSNKSRSSLDSKRSSSSSFDAFSDSEEIDDKSSKVESVKSEEENSSGWETEEEGREVGVRKIEKEEDCKTLQE